MESVQSKQEAKGQKKEQLSITNTEAKKVKEQDKQKFRKQTKKKNS